VSLEAARACTLAVKHLALTNADRQRQWVHSTVGKGGAAVVQGCKLCSHSLSRRAKDGVWAQQRAPAGLCLLTK